MLVLSSAILLGLLMRGGRWRHVRPQWGLFLPQLSGSRALYVKDVSGTFSIFFDRFIISAFLGLELTGVYTFFWSITNVVHSLALVGMLLSQLPSLLAAGRKADKTEFHAVERSLQIEIGAWTLLLSLGVAVATPLLLPYLGRPLLENYLFVFWMILFATILRVAADGYGYALLALNRDTEIAIIAFFGAIASAVLNAILTPLAGLWGAATSYVITAAGLLAIRYYLTRPQIYGRISST
jgi:O-antigen/teichoic acid export membrane protein